MKLLAVLGVALGGSALVAGVIQARPITIEESAVLTPPNNGLTYKTFGFHAASNGTYALVVGTRKDAEPEVTDYDALLYKRTSGGWQYVRTLASKARRLRPVANRHRHEGQPRERGARRL